MNAAGKTKKERPPGLDPRWPCRTIRLLLVDDEAAFVDTLANRLKKRRFKVSRAYNGPKAVQLLEKAKYDVALLDLKMGKMDGFDVLRVFLETAPDMPVIILSGHDSERTAKESLSSGAFDYVSKPCEFEDLLLKIQAAYYTTEKEAND